MTVTLTPTDPAPTAAVRRIAIIGGGASGTITALQLLRQGDAAVTVYERSGELAKGIAYGTTDPRHLLNVRASNMGALPDVPGDFVAWIRERGLTYAPTDFAARCDYARYLADRLAEAAQGRELRVVAENVTDIERLDRGFRVFTATASEEYDAVVLAYGNAAPPTLEVGGVAVPPAGWHIANPWLPGWADTLPEDATVVAVGTGLTAVDTAVSVLDAHPERRVIAVSQHGLLPKPHIDDQATSWVTPVPEGPLTADGIAELVSDQLAAAARRGVDWRWVIDGLRGQTSAIWQRLPLAERERFLARYSRGWEIRRHRTAPEVASRIAAWQAEGQLRVVAARPSAIVDEGVRARVTFGEESVSADVVVNCTGPLSDIERSGNALLAALVDRGLIRPDALRLGITATAAGEVLGRDGDLVPGLLVVGPPLKGMLYECTAVPEIRVQAARVPALLGIS